MKSLGVEVERSTMPTRIQLSTNEAELADPEAHPVKVNYLYPHRCMHLRGQFQVTLEHLEEPDGEPHEEIVHAKFVLGADGSEPHFPHAYTKTHVYYPQEPIRGSGKHST